MFDKVFDCCFCGKKIDFYSSNSTWGCWSDEEEGKGEKERCCNECNMFRVIPMRMQKGKEND